MDIPAALARLNGQLPLKARQNALPRELQQLHRGILDSLVARGAPPAAGELAGWSGSNGIDVAVQRLIADDLVVLTRDGTAVAGAYPLTTEVTPHRLTIGANTVYAMCALDAVSVAPMFATEVTIDSRCHISGVPVHIHMRGSDVLAADPGDVRVGVRWQMPCGVAAHSMCTEMVFLGDADAADAWRGTGDEDISVFVLSEAIEFGAAFFVPLRQGG